jgi:hypothetical protein
MKQINPLLEIKIIQPPILSSINYDHLTLFWSIIRYSGGLKEKVKKSGQVSSSYNMGSCFSGIRLTSDVKPLQMAYLKYYSII